MKNRMARGPCKKLYHVKGMPSGAVKARHEHDGKGMEVQMDAWFMLKTLLPHFPFWAKNKGAEVSKHAHKTLLCYYL